MLFFGGGPPSLLAVGNSVTGVVGGAATRLAFCLVTVLDCLVLSLLLLLLPQAANSRALQARANRLSGTRQLECDRISLSSIDGRLSGVALDQTELQAADLVDGH